MSGKPRVDWIDYGKGLSILLVVFHHILSRGEEPAFTHLGLVTANDVAVLVRMPFFFLMAGIFAQKAIALPWGKFLETKAYRFLYLYVLWSLVTWSITILLPYLASGAHRRKLDSILFLFTEPPKTLWFLYALLIFFALARILRRLPPAAQLTLALVGYCWSMPAGDLASPPFVDRLFRLFPFFLAGVHGSPWLRALPAKLRFGHLVALPLFFVGGFFLLASPAAALPPALLCFQAFGIFGLIAAAHFLARSGVAGFLRAAGEHSLAIYVVHRSLLHFATQLARLSPLPTLANIALALLLCAGGALWLERALAKRGVTWPFAPPPLKNSVSSLRSAWHRLRRWNAGSPSWSGNASS